MNQRKERKHSFPKTYTTAGACYRARKNFESKFPHMAFVITREDGNYILNIDHAETILKNTMETEAREIV